MKKLHKALTAACAILAGVGIAQSPAIAFSLNSSNPLKLMPLGDSNTRGKGSDRAGYRDDLWELFNDNGYAVDFVGSERRNPPDDWDKPYAFDRNHEGHGGYAIEGETYEPDYQLLPNVSDWVSAANPDAIAFMAGTNDFLFQETTAEETRNEMGRLLDEIYNASPDTSVFVSALPPLEYKWAKSADEVEDFNNLIPELVVEKREGGKNINFVDTRDLWSNDDLSDGIHLTEEGYNKLALAWYDSMVAAGNSNSPDSEAIADGNHADDGAVSVPEPTATFSLLGCGLFGVSALRKRKREA